MSEYVVVLDVGTAKTVCLAAEAAPNGLKVAAIGIAESKGVRRGQVEEPEHAAAAIQVAIERMEAGLHQPVEHVAVALSGPHVEGVVGQGFKPIVPRSRTITHQDVLEVVNHSRSLIFSSDREQVQAIPREYRVDAQRNIKQPVGMSGSKLEVITYLVTGRVAAMQALDQAVRGAGRTVDQMVLGPLASGLAVAKSEDLEAGCAAVDIGAGKTDVAIFANGSLALSACIPAGGGSVTSDIAALVKCSIDEAERLKLESGSALAGDIGETESVSVLQIGQVGSRPMQRRVLCEIIEARVREIAELVRKQIEDSGLSGSLPGGVILTGGGAALPNVDRLFAEVLAPMPVRIEQPRAPGSQRPGLATALGMAGYLLQSPEELDTAAGTSDWKHRVRNLWSSLSGKA